MARQRTKKHRPVDQAGTPLQCLDLVRVSIGHYEKKYRTRYPFSDGDVLLFMGEVNQMPGHCVVVDKSGRTWWGYHTEHFIRVTDDDNDDA